MKALLLFLSIGLAAWAVARLDAQQDRNSKLPDSYSEINESAAFRLLARARRLLETDFVKRARDADNSSASPQASGADTPLFLTAYPAQPGLSDASSSVVRPALAVVLLNRSTGPGAETSLDQAIDRAVQKLRSAMGSQPEYLRLKLDLVTSRLNPLAKPEDHMAAGDFIDIGVDGVAIFRGRDAYYVPPADMIYKGFCTAPETETASNLLDRISESFGLQPEAWRQSGVRLFAFHTASFIENDRHDRALKLVRGFVPEDVPSASRMLQSARAAGDYLVRMQKPDGSFCYIYDSIADRDSSGRYDIVRHSGAIISLFDLYQATGEPTYLIAARKGLEFLATRLRPLPGLPSRPDAIAGGDRFSSNRPDPLAKEPTRGENRTFVVDDDGKAKLGAGGLALLACARDIRSGRQTPNRLAQGLAAGILSMESADGSFVTEIRVADLKEDAVPSLYFPGEAILALADLYSITHDPVLLTGAERAADFLMRNEREQAALPPDAWFAEALEVLYGITGRAAYAEHAVDLAASMASSIYPKGSPDGFEGAVSPGLPRVTPAASRSEGILAGYRVARARKDPRALALLSALKESASFQLSQQFGPADSFFLPNPGRASGGFHESLASMRIRIDYVQHNISALIGLAAVTN